MEFLFMSGWSYGKEIRLSPSLTKKVVSKTVLGKSCSISEKIPEGHEDAGETIDRFLLDKIRMEWALQLASLVIDEITLLGSIAEREKVVKRQAVQLLTHGSGQAEAWVPDHHLNEDSHSIQPKPAKDMKEAVQDALALSMLLHQVLNHEMTHFRFG